MRAARALAASVALAALLGGCGGGEEEEAVPANPRFGEQPNFVFVLTDDQTLPQYSRAAMPNAHRLFARNGTTFEHHVATTPVCCPSRASMLTGQYGHNNGVLTNVPGYGDLADPQNVLPVWLQRVGYSTGYVGKWLNGYKKAVGEEEEVPPGWDEWYGLVGSHGYYRFKASVNGEKTGPRKSYLTRTLNKKAVAMVRKLSGSTPFYLQLSHLAPHGESKSYLSPGECGGFAVPPPRDLNRFQGVGLPPTAALNEPDVSDKPGYIRRKRLMPRRQVEGFADRYECRTESLLAVDRGIAELTRALAVEDELKDTVFVFGSDNGVFHAEHRLPAGKGLPYREAYEIPFAMRVPERYRGGRPAPPTVELPTANIDLVPTIAELAGAPACGEDGCRVMDGRSLVPLLIGREDGWPRERPLAVEFDAGTSNVKLGRAISCRYSAALTPRWLYVRHAAIPGPGGECVEKEFVEQYDLVRDPDQVENLARQPEARPQRAEGAAQRLAVLVDELSDCAGIKGRDPEPPSGHYCR